jgi:FKBP-type peptidyl-prolyl cis-trans isomerase FklB
MKKLGLIVAASVMAPVIALASPLKTDTQKISYTFGARFGMELAKQKLNLNLQDLLAGLKAGYSGKNLQMTDAEMTKVSKEFLQMRYKEMKEATKLVAKKNQEAGQKFLAANAKKSGVKSFSNGVQYKILKAGTGATPTMKSTVTVNYTGSLIGGTVFDSSYKRGQPAVFPVDAVIPGWQTAITHMKVGGTWMVYIPSKLAYKNRGVPGSIPPGATLVFKVHLISVKN